MRYLVAAMVTSWAATAAPASAAIITKNINISRVLAQPTVIANENAIVGQALYSLPVFDARLGTLNAITLYLDLVRSTTVKVTRSASNTPGRDLFLNAVDVIGNNVLDRNFGQFLSRQGGPLYLPEFVTSATYVVPVSYSTSASFSVDSDAYRSLAADGFRFDSRSIVGPEAGLAVSLRNRGTGVITIAYDYSLRPLLGAVSPLRVSAVPEPTTWAMMIGGLGAVGGMFRRRRNIAAGACGIA